MTQPGPILVTGASGFVGRRLTARLRREGLPVVAVGSHGDTEMTETCDLRDRDSVNRLVKRHAPTRIVHLAAISSVGQAESERLHTWDINFGGTANLAVACMSLNHPVRFVFTSSAEVYGATFLDGPCTESDALQPLSTYGRSKAAAEWMLRDAASPSLQVLIARPFNHTGSGQDSRFVIPALATQIAAAGVDGVVHVGNLEAVRDFSDVADLIDALVTMTLASHEPEFSVFNIGSGLSRSIRTLLDRLAELADAKVRIELDRQRMRPAEIPVAEGVFDAFDKSFGPRTRYPFDNTLREILADAKRHLAHV